MVPDNALRNFVQTRNQVLTNIIVWQENTTGSNIKFQDSVQLPSIENHAQKHNKGEGKGGGKNSNNESREEMCSICQCEFTVSGNSGTGLQCPSSHHICYQYSGIFVGSILSEIEVSYPSKCPLCKDLLPKDQFNW